MTAPVTPPTPATDPAPLSPRQRSWFHRGIVRTGILVASFAFADPTPTSLAAAWAVIAAGCALHLWARGCLRINLEVTTSGPYRWVRNPFYLATLLLDLGICIAGRNPWVTAVSLAVWAVAYTMTIRYEEATLLRLFGERFEAYRARVPVLFPWRGPVRGLAPSQPFSWRNPSVAEGREYARLVRAFAAPLLVVVVHACVFRTTAALSATGPVLTMAVPALAALWVLEMALLLRIRHGRRLVPDALHALLPRLAVTAALAFAALGTDLLHVEPSIVSISLGLGLCAVVLASAAVLPRALHDSAAALRTMEATVCLAGGILAAKPWLGALGFAWFVVLAVDATGRPAAPEGAGARDRSGLDRWTIAALAVVLAAAAVRQAMGAGAAW